MAKENPNYFKLSEENSIASHDELITGLSSFETIKNFKEGEAYVTRTLQAVVHEIRNPLVSVAGFAKRLCHVVDPFSESGRYAHIILQEALRLEEALNEMMKSEEGGFGGS